MNKHEKFKNKGWFKWKVPSAYSGYDKSAFSTITSLYVMHNNSQ